MIGPEVRTQLLERVRLAKSSGAERIGAALQASFIAHRSLTDRL
jgi:hypothetical protein